jgi:Arc/MetJ-type ribon-helix-helix transcriptional regulator
MHQENPNIRMIGVKLTQELYRKTEKRVAERKMKDVSQLVRFLITEETVNTPLTDEDKRIIEERKASAKITGKSKRRAK